MDDSISRQDALTCISNLYPNIPINREWWYKKYEPFIKCEEAIKSLPPAQQWIPCSERLPEEGELILLYFRPEKDTPHLRLQIGYLGSHDVEDYDFQKIGVAQVWYTDKFYWSFDKVVAWMPLPKPYKGE